MTVDRSFIELNHASTERIRALAERLTDDELQCPVGQHWTVAIALAHLAFWDWRVIYLLDGFDHKGELSPLDIDIVVNDLSLPFWAGIPPRKAAQLAIQAAEALDERLEKLPPALLEQVHAANERWVNRALHRDEHLVEVDAAISR